MNTLQPGSVDISVKVVSGAGSSSFKINGELASISFIPGSGTPTYDFEITDADGYGVDGGTSLTGATTVNASVVISGTCTLAISNATADSTFKVRVWYKAGH